MLNDVPCPTQIVGQSGTFWDIRSILLVMVSLACAAGVGGGGGGDDGEAAEDAAGRGAALGIQDLVGLEKDRVGAGLGGGEVALGVDQAIRRQNLGGRLGLGVQELWGGGKAAGACDQEV